MKHDETIYDYLRQFVIALATHRRAFDFIKEHRPWAGIREYRWAARLGTLVAVIFGLIFFMNLLKWWSGLGGSGDPTTFQAGMYSFLNDFAWENLKWVLSGGSKYLILVLLEILVFHFTRFTLEILTGEKSDSSFNAFVKAEIRMIKVALRSWILEIITIAILGVVLGILGLKGWKPFFGFFVQCYFVGFAMIDNYFECFGATIKESAKKIWKFAGASVGVGIVAYSLMYVPVVGVIIATILGAVTATMVMYRLSPPMTVQTN